MNNSMYKAFNCIKISSIRFFFLNNLTQSVAFYIININRVKSSRSAPASSSFVHLLDFLSRPRDSTSCCKTLLLERRYRIFAAIHKSSCSFPLLIGGLQK